MSLAKSVQDIRGATKVVRAGAVQMGLDPDTVKDLDDEKLYRALEVLAAQQCCISDQLSDLVPLELPAAAEPLSEAL